MFWFKNAEKAIKYYKKGSDIILSDTQDYTESNIAFKYIKLAAKFGDVDAINLLGWCYHKGFGIEVNEIKAIKYYKIAFKKKCRLAIYNLSVCYSSGFGTTIDKKKAFEYMELAAEKNDPRAQYYTGVYYEFGRGVEKNIEKALYWYEKSYKNGYYEANAAINFLKDKKSPSNYSPKEDQDIETSLDSWKTKKS
ncbi:MAG: sel1 repeat family protein [Mycoplasmataceae bacterium]|nr:sel1 repeat family protein [Mycoplasmataceae bacterium]